MFASIHSFGLHGARAYHVSVESDLSDGLPGFIMVGYLGAAVREAQERVRTALRNSGYYLPPRKITVNLSPAGVRKQGTAYDLAIAAAVLTCTGAVRDHGADDMAIVGELALDGTVLPTAGILPRVLAAQNAGFRRMAVPKENVPEAMLAGDIAVLGVHSLRELAEAINAGAGGQLPGEAEMPEEPAPGARGKYDFEDVEGLPMVRLAAEAAAAGKHNILLIGPAGTGKTMIARCLATIMPSMDLEESLRVTELYSICGLLDPGHPLIRERPFRAPHHSITTSSLLGGGNYAKPGELSLASGGILFLDELPEFPARTLDLLRQPMEDGEIVLSRLNNSERYPADIILAAAMNPCKCGLWPSQRCRCTPAQISQYLGRVSGPFLDRIDIGIEVPKQKIKPPGTREKGESSAAIRGRVMRAVQIQEERFRGTGISRNSRMNGAMLAEFCRLGKREASLLTGFADKYSLSIRGTEKLLKLARTLADLSEKRTIGQEELMQAAAFRSFESRYWKRG